MFGGIEREVMRLFNVKNWTPSEIADRLNLTEERVFEIIEKHSNKENR